MGQQIRDFLLEFKEIVSKQGIYLVPRNETNATLGYLGLTRKIAKDIFLSLSVANYSKGPEEDTDRGGELWIFGKEIKGEEVYIKLKVTSVNGSKIAKCISFHIAVRALNYPFR